MLFFFALIGCSVVAASSFPKDFYAKSGISDFDCVWVWLIKIQSVISVQIPNLGPV